MQQLPHNYSTSAKGESSGSLSVSCSGLPDISCAPPTQFGGPGDQWSPEDLLLASVSSCLILSFRAIARASKLDWIDIDCKVDGTLDRVERQVKFTELVSHVVLTIDTDTDPEKAGRLVEKAEQSCLISNSLNCPNHLTVEIKVEQLA